MSFKATVLWIHVVGGVIWIISSAGVVVAATALAQEADELAAVLKRSAAIVNLLGIGCACVMAVTGLLNLAAVARTDRHALNSEFLAIVTVKAGLYIIMLWALWRAIELVQLTGPEAEGERQRRIVRAYEVVAGGGAVALLCGLWLAGLG